MARIGFLFYGIWQDSTMRVKFTDVDYSVFTDAAQFITEGKSPFLRPTYRYTPLLAWILTSNIWISQLCGKVIFITFDLFVGQLIYQILIRLGHKKKICQYSALIWLLNPLCATVSSRGNAESVVAWLVLMTLSLLLQRKTAASAIFYALSIHFKIYPVTFALPIYLYLGMPSEPGTLLLHKEDSSSAKKFNKGRNIKVDVLKLVTHLLPNKERLIFMTVTSAVLGTLTLIFYWMYGWQFLFETYLYHIVRGDIRHNFSPYFYLLYLMSANENGVPLCLRLLVFLPQAILLLVLAFKFYHRPPLCWFLSVFIFVAFNKVCTSQYFLWYLSLVPLVIPDLDLRILGLAKLLLLWLGGQAAWLLPAYLLEFQGYNTFLQIWISGLLFLTANALVVYRFITTHRPEKQKRLHISLVVHVIGHFVAAGIVNLSILPPEAMATAERFNQLSNSFNSKAFHSKQMGSCLEKGRRCPNTARPSSSLAEATIADLALFSWMKCRISCPTGLSSFLILADQLDTGEDDNVDLAGVMGAGAGAGSVKTRETSEEDGTGSCMLTFSFSSGCDSTRDWLLSTRTNFSAAPLQSN
ncbi:GPI mannosyltransferase 1 [Plakobranchus ocellatus]|uniref:GPI alpha-1,4-mannosyltransferase I, catalytic subunit n=1 Tax=Plakobranchus ocellatus TaxID=259542 RepID=A0AAV3Z9X7_9GAST|nr:GPI mannosyltransferase 1 [Plakobranchus ocellatus]